MVTTVKIGSECREGVNIAILLFFDDDVIALKEGVCFVGWKVEFILIIFEIIALERLVTFLQFCSCLSFGNESSPRRIREKKPVKSIAKNKRSSCDVELLSVLLTSLRSSNVKALFLFVATPLRRLQPFRVLSTKSECREGRTSGK